MEFHQVPDCPDGTSLRFEPEVTPDSPQVTSAIEKALARSNPERNTPGSICLRSTDARITRGDSTCN